MKTAGAAVKALVARSAVYGLGTIGSALATILLIPFYLQHLTPYEYGLYALADMVGAVLTVLIVTGLNISLLAHFSANDSTAQRSLIGSALLVLAVTMVGWGTLYAILLYGRREFVIPGLPKRLALLALVVACGESLWAVLSAFYRAKGSASYFMIGSLGQVAGTMLTTIVLVGYYGMKGEGILYGRIAGACLVVVPSLAHQVRWGFRPNVLTAKGLGREGGALILAALAGMILSTGPRYLINLWATPAEVGVFAMSARLAGSINVLLVQPFSLAWIPIIRLLPRTTLGMRICGEVAGAYVVIGTVLIGCAITLSGWVAETLGHGAFSFDSQLLLVLCAANVLAGLVHAVNVGPYLCGRPTAQVPVFLLTAVIGGLTCTIGLYGFGLVGLASALAITYGLQAALLRWVSQQMFPFRIQYLRVLLYVGGVAAAYVLVETCLSRLHVYQAPVLRTLVFTILAAVALWSLGFGRGVSAILNIERGAESQRF